MIQEYDREPIPGLPERLPAGENLLWQGSPEWRSVARRVFHALPVAIYFATMLAWRIGTAYSGGESTQVMIFSMLWLIAIGGVGLGLIVLLAKLTAKTTIYSITSKRVVLRYGIAFPICVNLPFAAVLEAGLQQHADGTGDIVMTMNGNGGMAYLHLWPHARPWHLSTAKPALRSLVDPVPVANLLSTVLAETHPSAERYVATAARPEPLVRNDSMHAAAGTA